MEPLEDIDARIDISPFRYWFILGVLAVFCSLLIRVIWTTELALSTQIALYVGLGFALYLTVTLLRHERSSLILTQRGVETLDGKVLCEMSEIESVDRGGFSFKPSKGFLIRLKTERPTAWHPGLWWQFGKKIGVGGLTSTAQCKKMAELLVLRLKFPDGWPEIDPANPDKNL